MKPAHRRGPSERLVPGLGGLAAEPPEGEAGEAEHGQDEGGGDAGGANFEGIEDDQFLSGVRQRVGGGRERQREGRSGGDECGSEEVQGLDG